MKVLTALCALFLAIALVSPARSQTKPKTISGEEIKRMSETTAVIETKFGNIQLKFFPDVAPGHVKNFIDLAKKGFFDGTTFHRVIPKFMIQGGDPNSKDPDRSKHGMGGPGYNIKAEFNDKPHKRWTLSMARANQPDSAGSQFFICVADAAFLNKQYTVFGEVVTGMDVADKIVSQPRDRNDNPLERVEMTVKIIEATWMSWSGWNLVAMVTPVVLFLLIQYVPCSHLDSFPWSDRAGCLLPLSTACFTSSAC